MDSLHDVAGVERKGRTLHCGHHTHASQLIGDKVPLGDVAARPGDTVATVLRYYARFIPGEDRARAAVFKRAPRSFDQDHQVGAEHASSADRVRDDETAFRNEVVDLGPGAAQDQANLRPGGRVGQELEKRSPCTPSSPKPSACKGSKRLERPESRG